VHIEQLDDDGQVHFVAVPPDDPAATRLFARSAWPDVPTMYHANGKQWGTAGNIGDLRGRSEQGKIDVYEEERLALAACS
jgi:hypothetical protein